MTGHPEPGENDYRLSLVLQEFGATIIMDKRIACRRCPNADWAIDIIKNEYGEDDAARCFCAAFGRQTYPAFAIKACDARLRAIKAERPQRLATDGAIDLSPL